MIVGIVGDDRPFDRLIRTLDLWASRNPHESVCAQIGNSEYRPGYMECIAELRSSWVAEALGHATLAVTHASLDIVGRALRAHVPVLVLPRHPMFGEDSSDGQLALAERLGRTHGVYVVEDEDQLFAALSDHAVRPLRQNAPFELGSDLRTTLAHIASRGAS